MNLKPLTPHLGAEVKGVDLSETLSDDNFSALHQAFMDWGVLVFRDQHLSREQHKAFASRFGKLHIHPLHSQKDREKVEHPEILKIRTTANSAYTAGDGWHTDVTCDEYPPMASALYITETPECGGGDTLFANMYLAYELLSDTIKNMLGELSAIHDGAIPYVGSYKTVAPDGGYPKSEHPVITRHPVTGRKLLYVNSGFTSHIRGLKPAESRAILDMLYNHIASTPRLIARVQWQPNTLTLWDNRCTQHHAVWDYHPHSRYGERVSVVADSRPCA